MLGGRDHLGSPKRDHNLDNHPYVHLHPANSCSLSQDKICFFLKKILRLSQDGRPGEPSIRGRRSGQPVARAVGSDFVA